MKRVRPTIRWILAGAVCCGLTACSEASEPSVRPGSGSGSEVGGSSNGGAPSNGGASGAGGVSGGDGGSGGEGGSSAIGDAGGAGGGSGAEGSGGSAGSGTGGSNGGGGSDGTCTPGTGTKDVGANSLLDQATCLTWQKSSSGKMTNKQALKYCAELTDDGYGDWRVPTTDELVTWPNLAVSGDAYITSPTYIPKASSSDAEGCMVNSHSCNISLYSAGNLACAWQGVAFAGPAVCVRGTAASGTLSDTYAPDKCGACAAEVTSSFKIVDCLPYAQ
jgi:hypothetical protein